MKPINGCDISIINKTNAVDCSKNVKAVEPKKKKVKQKKVVVPTDSLVLGIRGH